MAQMPISPVVLIILDGWGEREETDGNAVAAANLPIMNSLKQVYPNTKIKTSGRDVGLPDGQMGNSEVGHLNLGAGRVVPQELVRISDAVEDNSLFRNARLVEICQTVHERGSKLHLVGLCSDGGVHSHIDHLIGLIDLAKLQGIGEVCLHLITDGRDTSPQNGVKYIERVQEHINRVGIGRIVTVSGRYYAMDRDRRWDRVKTAYDVMTQDAITSDKSATEVLQATYADGKSDEFVQPVRLAPGVVAAGDGVIFFNFRPDRARQLTQAFVDPKFDGFECDAIQPLEFVTFTQYDGSLPVKVAFEPQKLDNILGEVISKKGLKQFRTAETEKYAHVTYFFNGGLEDVFPGEDRELVNSPMVATYDESPAMSAMAVTKAALKAIRKREYSLIVMNYANPDMVGHTGNIDATVTALETVDKCVGQLLEGISQAGGTALITADHGNAEQMWDENGNPWTAHTTNEVPLILVEGEGAKIPGHGTEVQLRANGCLADIAPTILEILRINQPAEMTGESLIVTAEYDAKANRTPVKIGR
ncbi:2,3-bisphosphoglycerate-independent phosphoglycerate mutase [filamentous cyanobacterium LEGE 11480]|uniref:2,3-bisphosphoglycerate-independent phosphoglycerate mutase n=1 Tax=Romeriopsis navalis LEGE 11480 TaxID=2777977 RepID=A0A928VLH7_9CYAN|nr:2,3-bisphosphoglycerate-independent phosphoglycerate mutase [Romeriopsis navalis]MBE9028811.1 2,3-bisphosphoglycerate-independent phosphoglycerate mutase [Romeriopsis navalis LEGE 11480]